MPWLEQPAYKLRRRARVSGRSCPPPRCLVGGDEMRRNPAQALEVDAARARYVTHREVHGCEPHMCGEALIPAAARIGCRRELVENGTAHRLIGFERPLDVAALLADRFGERDG